MKRIRQLFLRLTFLISCYGLIALILAVVYNLNTPAKIWHEWHDFAFGMQTFFFGFLLFLTTCSTLFGGGTRRVDDDDDSPSTEYNVANGLPMSGGVDIMGNANGMDH